MATTTAVDPGALTALADYYRQQSNASVTVRSYVDAHCQLNGDIGLLLTMLERKYNSARETCMEAFDQVTQLTGHVAEQIEAHRDYMVAHEQDTTKTVEDLSNQLDGCGNPPTGGSSGAGGSSAAGGSGGSAGSGAPRGGGSHQPSAGATYTGGNGDIRAAASADVSAPATTAAGDANPSAGSGASSATAPAPVGASAPAPAGTDTPTSISAGAGASAPVDVVGHLGVVADGPATGNVTVGGSGNVINAGDGVQVVVGDGATAQVTIVQQGTDLDALRRLLEQPDGAAAAQQAADAASYRHLWEELAAHDPLGRSADELSAAWEAREPVTLDAGAAAELGSSAATPLPDDLVGTLLTPARVAAAAGMTTGALA